MSSIDSLNSNLSAMTPSSDAWSQLSPEERKLLEQAKSQEGVGDITGLLGMTPNQMAGVATNVQQNKFTQVGASRYLTPPSAPKVQVTQRQIDAYHSMTQDVNTALESMTSRLQGVYLRPTRKTAAQQGATQHGAHEAGTAAAHHGVTRAAQGQSQSALGEGVYAQGQSSGQSQVVQRNVQTQQTAQGEGTPVDASTLGATGTSLTWAQLENGGKGSAAVQSLSKYVQSALGSMNSSDMMTAFLALQVTSQNDGLTTRQNLSNLSSQMRQMDLQNEIKQDQEAEKSVQKALAKARQMGALTKVLAVLTVILTAVLAVLTMGAGIGLAVVGAAMLIGGVAEGAKDGKKNGNGFDWEGFLNGAAMGGDVAMAAFGGLEIMAALEVTAETAASQVAKKSGELASKSAAKSASSAGEVAAKSGAQQAAQDSKDAVAAAINKAIKSIAEKSGMQKMADITKNILDNMVRAGGQTVKSVGQHTGLNTAGKVVAENVGKLRASDSVQAVGKSAGRTASHLRGENVGRLTPKGLIAANVGSIAVQSGGQIVQATLNYRSNKYNLDSEYHQQQSAIEQKMADSWEEEYQDLQNYMQQVSQSHSKAVNQAMSMLTSHFQSGMKAAQNIAG